ncbi:MFS transporter [Actinomadura hibisca]|uniref:MFS transporter n=1 Tax=Actinomadura hibisca TaxID=68565 RepID=UPI001FE1EC50|nr:MFS transporter [Actinomadura hibisca]
MRARAASPTARLVKNPAVSPLFVARLFSSAGVGFGQVALLWGVKGLGYSPGAISIVLACKAAPALLILAGGIIGDRFKRHHVLAAAEILACLTWSALGICFLVGNAPLPLLCALALLSGIATALFLPTIRSVIADLLDDGDRQTGNALISKADSAGLLIGLSSSGLVITLVGPGWAAGAKGLLCAISALLITRLRTERRQSGRSRAFADLRTGWRHFTGHRWVWVMTLQFTVVIIAVACFTEIIGPLHLSRRNGGAGAWGIIAACEALGALIGAFAGARWKPRRPVLVATMLPASAAIPMVFLGGGARWELVAAAMLIPGMCQAVYYVFWTTELQKTFPGEALARVNSWGIVGSFSLTPIALLLAGPMVETIGTRAAAFGVGAGVVAATALALSVVASSQPALRTGVESPVKLVGSL